MVDPFVQQIDSAEITAIVTAIEIQAFDDRGVVIGVVSLIYLPGGELHLAEEYDDGRADTFFTADGEPGVVRSSLPDGVAAKRANAIAAVATEDQPGAVKCGMLVLAAIGACYSPLWVWTCGPGAFIAACECLPLVVPDDWPYEEC